ncbi:ABC transporter substrate-binding protein [Streptomyces sp. NPDC048523]|uniref:ABC transporter substrate-binding protein n=1 Tax=Streptomyces sp. NPDC048523 TaxID=3365567 RepID=UPI00371F8E61
MLTRRDVDVVPRAVRRLLTTVLVLASVATACGYGSQAPGNGTGNVAAKGARLSAQSVRIGFFPNLTHATVLVGDAKGFFRNELGGTEVRFSTFNAGPSEIEALNSESIDIGWIGPSPAVNGYIKSGGKSLRIVGGSVSGGVKLVVDPDKIKSLKDVKGKKIATPQLGNTQDVAFLNWIADQGWKVDALSGKGDVSVFRTDNKVTPDAYRSGSIDGAWVPEPTASKLVAEGAKVLLDESSLWPAKKFAVTNIIVSQPFLDRHPDVVEAVLRASIGTNEWINSHPAAAKAVANAKLATLTGKPLPGGVIAAAWSSLRFTDDPLSGTLAAQTEHAVRVGLLEEPELTGLYDLAPLNKILHAMGRSPVDDAGLGVQ